MQVALSQQVDNPPENPEPADEICALCSRKLWASDADTPTLRRARDGASVRVHQMCHDSWLRNREATEAEFRRRTGRVLEDAPRVPWTDVTDPEFRRRVRPPLLKFAERHNPRQHGGAVLLGPSGCGKTLAAFGLVHRLVAEIQKGRIPNDVKWLERAHWTSAHALARARRQYGLGDGEAPEVDRALYASLLVIDELGFEPQTEILFEVVDHRYTRRLPTIVTSGLTQAEFLARYGDALTRRLSGDGIGQLLDVHPREAGRGK